MRVPTTALAMALAACANGKAEVPVDAMGTDPLDAAAIVESACPAGEFATGFAFDGTLRCAPIDGAAKAAMSAHCSLYFGWRDSCDGCTTLPAKWGQVSGDACTNGVGINNTCAPTSLGGVTLPLFGLNIDGNANDDDKFYAGLLCTPPADDPVAGPCADGSFLTSVASGGECVTGQAAIADYLADGCQIYFGWQDNCDGCTSAPTKWGHADTSECTVGAGANNTCTSFNLGGAGVATLGVNTDGDVNGDDKFYLGFQCNGALASESVAATECPAGELVVAIDSDGVHCASPIPEAEVAVQDGCYLYFGWRDSCNGCTTAPSKWGRVSHSMCENGAGTDNTCASTPLDGASIQLLGVNTDGDVDDNDKFYLGVSCP